MLATSPAIAQSFVPTGGTTSLQPADIQARTFDPRNYGAIASGAMTPIGSVYSGATVESLAATSVNGATPFSFLNTDQRAGVKFTLQLTAITDSQHLVFTMSQGGGNGAPAVAGVPSFNFNPAALFAQVIPGMVLTDLKSSGATKNLTVSSVVPWPVLGETQPSGTPGTIVLSGPESGMAVNDTIQFEIPASILDSTYSMDWLGTAAAMHAANVSGGRVSLGPGSYEMGQGGLYAYGDNPIVVQGAGKYETTLQWNTSAQIGGVYMGDEAYQSGSNRPRNEYQDFTIASPHISNPTYGVAPDPGIDLFLGEDSVARRVFVNGGYAGFGFLGDHQRLEDVGTESVFYGVFEMPFSPSNGNQDLINTSLQGYQSALGISYNATFNDGFVGNGTAGEWGQSPHLIFKETSFNSLIPSTAVGVGCFTNSKVDWLPAENVGGTPIECNAGSFNGNELHYFAPAMTSNSSLDISSENNSYFVHTTATMSGNRWIGSDFQTVQTMGTWPTKAWFYAGNFGANDYGDMTITINYGNNVPLLSTATATSVSGNIFNDFDYRNASGSSVGGYQHIEALQNYNAGGAALTAGQIVTTGQYGFPEVSRVTGAGQYQTGVVLQGCAFGSTCLIVEQGMALVAHETTTGTTASTGAAVYLYSGNQSTGTVSTAASDQGFLLGSLASPMSSGSVTPILVTLK